MKQIVVKMFYRLCMLAALALTELQEVSQACKQVFKEFVNKFIRFILKKYKGAKLQDLMQNVDNHRDWEKYARQLDYLYGTNEYKLKNESRLYDYERIESRYRIMK